MKRFWFQEDGQVFILEETQILCFLTANVTEATNRNLAMKTALFGWLFFLY